MRRLLLVVSVVVTSVACRDEPSSAGKASTASLASPASPAASAPSLASATPRAVVEPPAAPPQELVCQQVLVSYKGATKAKRGLTRTRDEARARAAVVAGMAHDAPEDFDDLVKKFSDDPSAERLGSTGLVKRADLVKPFADAAFALQIGQVTGVVESPFGFHVIKRTQ